MRPAFPQAFPARFRLIKWSTVALALASVLIPGVALIGAWIIWRYLAGNGRSDDQLKRHCARLGQIQHELQDTGIEQLIRGWRGKVVYR